MKRTFAVLAIALSATAVASATPVTGTISIAGNDTFDSTQITFNPSTGMVTQASGTLASFAPVVVGGLSSSYQALLKSFTFANASNVQIFSVSNATQTASFTISNLLTHVVGSDSNGPTLSLSGTGFFNETGYDQTSGTFSLTSSTAGITGFQLVSNAQAAATPEPSSLILLGTGLVGAAGTMMRRRKLAA